MNISEIEKITRHYDKYFQQDNCIVLHPKEAKLHIDAVLYAPTEHYPFWKFATVGACDYKMKGKNSLSNRNEYMLFIDPSVDMNDKLTAIKYYDLLVKTALFPYYNNTLISYGHSLEFADENLTGVVGAFLELPQAIDDTGLVPDKVLIDGNPIGAHPRELCVVKGDARIACISAASIVAKVTRDALMVSYEEEYPGYHLAECKGYGSAAHVGAIRERGLTPIHRRSFCGNFVEQLRLF